MALAALKVPPLSGQAHRKNKSDLRLYDSQSGDSQGIEQIRDIL
jgi:hypothetical protein